MRTKDARVKLACKTVKLLSLILINLINMSKKFNDIRMMSF